MIKLIELTDFGRKQLARKRKFALVNNGVEKNGDEVNEYDSPFKLTDAELANFSLDKLKIQIEDSDMIDRHQMDYVLVARYLNTPVAMVEYATYDGDSSATANIKDVFVFEKLRRKGIATAMYDYIRKHEKLQIKTFGNVKTKDGTAFRREYDTRVKNKK
jgi:hypothetical protein